MKKYEFTGETKRVNGRTLHRIRALTSFGSIKAGQLGGWIEKEENLADEGDAWVYGDAKVFGDAKVYDDAKVYGDAKVYDNAVVCKTNHYLVIGSIGSRLSFTTFYRDKNNDISVKCGCFNGTIDEFEKKVKETHKDGKHAKVYLLAVEMAKVQIELEDDNES